MMRIWDSVVRPLVDTVALKTLVEVGAEEGNGTRKLLRYLNERGGVLHCVDPVPSFDPVALAERFGGSFCFHQGLSLEVIPSLPVFEVGLLDGDHNWYTVFHELRAIETLHGHEAERLPLLFLHDTGWPYGRRDLYYDPESIPEAFRQPFLRAGMFPERSELEEARGMNCDLCNARHSGGAKNGVMTGIEDYVAESSLEIRKIDLPIYYGLTILVTEQRLELEVELASALEALQSAAGMRRLLAESERLRCAEGIVLQSLSRKLRSLQDQLPETESDR